MKKILIPISYVLVVLAAVMCTLLLTQNSSGGKLQELQQLLVTKFVDGVEAEQLEEAAAEAMVDALGDRWSYYISADAYQSYLDSKNNSYVGIGVTIQVSEQGYAITQVSEGGPAAQEGILAGDIITKVDGVFIVGMSTDEGSALVKGEAGTTVSITVLRQEQELTFTVTRGTVKTVVATGQLLDGNIGLVTIANFNSGCYAETKAVVDDLIAQGATALIFDVRNNGGGYKSEMVKLLDYLLPEGPLFRSYYYTGATSVDESDANCIELPMAVLINRYSYSAAEFFAAALREYDWAVLVGEQTVGKGHFQETFVLSDGSAVAVSTGRYTTPDDVDLEGVGLTPDVAVEVTDEVFAQIYAGTIDPMEDPQVLAAINALKSAENP